MVSVLFSPCHLTSIPLIVGYVGGQNQVLAGRKAALYAVVFTFGLFITIAAIGIICAMLGRMLGDVGPYMSILVGVVLVWVGTLFSAWPMAFFLVPAPLVSSHRFLP
jgi:cytochrome c-type biogenesis protein